MRTGLCQAMLLFIGLLAFSVGTAMADSINGYLDVTYFSSDMKTEGDVFLTADTKTQGFTQQYSLTLDKQLYPNLRLLASGLFDGVKITQTPAEQDENTTRRTLIKPSLELRWSSFPFSADLFYWKQRDKISGTNFPDITEIIETYQGRLGWKPVDLPTLDVYLNRTNAYDKAHAFRDTTNDQISWTSFYQPTRTLQMKYQGNYIDQKDNLRGVESRNLGNNFWTQYTNSFFRNRVNVNASYEISRSDIKVDVNGKGGGEVALPVLPFSGLSSLTNTPQSGALDPNPLLTDEDVLVSAGINIGLPPVGGDARPRNIGLDFFTEAEINTIWIWIDREQLPDAFANFYSWAVYTSSDNVTWTLRAQVSPAPFVAFRTRFEIRFPNVKARFFKVVVRPLTPTVVASDPTFPNPDQIFVTEMQAFILQAVSGKSSSSSTNGTTQNVNTSVNVLLLRKPLLYYDFSYFLMRTSSSVGPTVTSWNLSNALSATQPLNRVFTANARLARTDTSYPQGDGTTTMYSVGLDAVPISTLYHNLSYARIKDEQPIGTTTTDSVILSNTAHVYKGIDAYLNMGASSQSAFDGTTNKSYNLNGAITVVPNPKLTVTLSQGLSNSRMTGAGEGEITTKARSTDLSVSYAPYPSLYAYASWSWQSTDVRSDLLQNYNINWSPFQGGALLCNFGYNESRSSQDDSKVRAISSTIRLNLSKGSYLSFYYSMIKNKFGNSAVGFGPLQSQVSYNQTETRYTVEYRQNF